MNIHSREKHPYYNQSSLSFNGQIFTLDDRSIEYFSQKGLQEVRCKYSDYFNTMEIVRWNKSSKCGNLSFLSKMKNVELSIKAIIKKISKLLVKREIARIEEIRLS